MSNLCTADEAALIRLATALVNQQSAKTVVAPQQDAAGFWFGGGNMVQAPNGPLFLVGRYRNAGDSRRGITAGERGLQLSVLRSNNAGSPFEPILTLDKNDLEVDNREVLSIEGTALRFTPQGNIELFVSSEKASLCYPESVKGFLKPGTGVWTIDRIQADSLDGLYSASIHTILESSDPQYIHLKDPFLYETSHSELMLLFCSHPYCWTSSNTGYAILEDGTIVPNTTAFDFFPRGFTWDVAMTRATCAWNVPRRGRFSNRHITLLFYDGGESVRNLSEHAAAIRRPRGYSCEEIGGLAYFIDDDFRHIQRLSKYQPLFISPWGTGCSRYVDILTTDTGVFATWQQSQPDHSQPLVMNFISMDQVERLLK